MSDDLSKRHSGDQLRINVNEPYELESWSKKFNVTPAELKKAVGEVGPIASKVREYFSKSTR